MTIKFADGTHIEIAATAFDGFVKHDLKWAEFVHGRAIVKKVPAAKNRCTHRFPQLQALDAVFILARRAAANASKFLPLTNTDKH